MYRFLLIFSLFVLVACSQKPAPLTSYGAGSGAGSAGIHTVSKGDTVYSLSKRYKVEMPEMILVNKLSAPFRLNVGQRLKLPPPQTYEVQGGDSLYTISRLFGVSQSRLASINGLSAPYRILPGQELRIPSSSQPKQYRQPTTTTAKVASVNKSILPNPKPQQSTTSKSVQRSFAKPSRFIRPVSGKVISSYGAKKDGLHNDGINIAAPLGASVKAAADGEVVYAGSGLKGYGNLVLIKHGGRYLTAYGHLREITVKKGAIIQSGQKIGSVGTSGQVSTPQLHFEIRKGTDALNPSKFI